MFVYTILLLMKGIKDIPDLKNKRVLLRVDFDVPVDEHGQIEESFRIKKQKEVLDYLVDSGAMVVLVGHLHEADDSFSSLIPQLHILLGYEIGFIKKIENIQSYFSNYSVPALLENIKSFSGEKDNSEELAKNLAQGFDLYINNAFAACHREYSSISAITKHLPSYAGFLIEEEIRQLEKAISAPKEGKLIIIGGAKASTKVPVIKNLINKSEAILLGGVVANDVLKEKGQDMGSSVVDENSYELLRGLDLKDERLIIPKDFIVFDNKILDIGDGTMKDYIDRIGKASMIIWNGPMGLFENPVFAKGTNEIAQAMVSSKAYKIVGGGDTISALGKINLLNKFDFVSTGGGAMLSYLSGNDLPGLKVLN